MSPDEVRTEYKGLRARERCVASHTPDHLPLLNPGQRELLTQWARADGLTRQRDALFRQAGGHRLEMAEHLVDMLMRHGWLSVKERLVHGAWQLTSVTWRDLAGLKAALGLDSAEDRSTRREQLLAEVAAWAASQPGFERAVEALTAQRLLPLAKLAERIALLKALAAWRADQRTGTRRDFALEARHDTKALSEAEWTWLDTCLDLPGLGVERFAPQLWLAGALSLHWGSHRCELQALHCVGLPALDLGRLTGAEGPQRYWLIENRASFERQAANRAPGVALIWLPGRPASSWLAAVEALLDRAPAPALISADPDPAGVEIALTAASLWQARSLVWQPHLMGVAQLQAAKTRPLDDHHDRALIARLRARSDLPDVLTALCKYMEQHGVKAEQEGWL